MGDFRDGFTRGCKKAGIPYSRKVKNGFAFHVLRPPAKTFMSKAGVDKNARAVIFGHSINGDVDFRKDHVHESDLLYTIDRTEIYLEIVSEDVCECRCFEKFMEGIVVPKARLELARGNPH